MKRNGKYEGKPADANKKQVKSLLLQTYFTSLLSLVLCVSMFFGTSYAWFTSEVTSSDNEIYVGTLNVGLFELVNGYEDEGRLDLSERGKALFDDSVHWEPGYTSLEKIKIINEGELDFKYVLNFTDGNVARGDKDLKDVAQHFDVWIYDHSAKTQRVFNKPTTYKEISVENGWEELGTLDKLLAGKIVLSGELKVGDDSHNTYTIALHMKETADASLMGHSIGLSVKLVAYQMATEADGLGNKNYDDIAAVADAADLKKALNNADNVLLTSNITISAVEERTVMRCGVLDGGNKTITYTGGRQNDSSVGVLTTNGGSISNLTIKGGENGRALFSTQLTSDLVVSNCTFSGAYAFNLNSAVETEYILSFKECNFNDWVSYANVMDCAYFTDCTFSSTVKPYGSTVLTDCEFTSEGLDVSALDSGVEIELINCTYKDIKIDNAIVTENGIEGTNAIKIVDGKVVLSNT